MIDWFDRHSQDKQIEEKKAKIAADFDFNNMTRADILTKRSQIAFLVEKGEMKKPEAEVILKTIDGAEKLMGLHDKGKSGATTNVLERYSRMTDLQLQEELEKLQEEEQKLDDEYNGVIEKAEE